MGRRLVVCPSNQAKDRASARSLRRAEHDALVLPRRDVVEGVLEVALAALDIRGVLLPDVRVDELDEAVDVFRRHLKPRVSAYMPAYVDVEDFSKGVVFFFLFGLTDSLAWSK